MQHNRSAPPQSVADGTPARRVQAQRSPGSPARFVAPGAPVRRSHRLVLVYKRPVYGQSLTDCFQDQLRRAPGSISESAPRMTRQTKSVDANPVIRIANTSCGGGDLPSLRFVWDDKIRARIHHHPYDTARSPTGVCRDTRRLMREWTSVTDPVRGRGEPDPARRVGTDKGKRYDGSKMR